MIQTILLHTSLLNTPSIECGVIIPSSCRKTLCWLHGRQENHHQILKSSILPMLAEQYHTAIILPDVPDTYYIDRTWNASDFLSPTAIQFIQKRYGFKAFGICYTARFIAEELLPSLCHQYHLPDNREDTAIAGCSMGGFGSLLIGSHYPEVFGKIASISGAFIIDDLLIGNEEITGSGDAVYLMNQRSYFQSVFGEHFCSDLDTSAERNPLEAALHALEQGHLPPVYLACGTDDMLYGFDNSPCGRNRKLFHQLKASGADITWAESTGGHNWKCYNRMLKNMMVWLTQ